VTELERLKKKLAKIEAAMARDHEVRDNATVGSSRFWKADRRLDYDAMDRQKLRVKIAELEAR
jgi:hypothetical protein